MSRSLMIAGLIASIGIGVFLLYTPNTEQKAIYNTIAPTTHDRSQNGQNNENYWGANAELNRSGVIARAINNKNTDYLPALRVDNRQWAAADVRRYANGTEVVYTPTTGADTIHLKIYADSNFEAIASEQRTALLQQSPDARWQTIRRDGTGITYQATGVWDGQSVVGRLFAGQQRVMAIEYRSADRQQLITNRDNILRAFANI